MKYKIVWPDPEYQIVLICVMDVGKIQVHASDQHKTALCHEQGLGLFQFTRLPLGLTGAPSPFQQLIDKHFRDLPFVTAYMDYLLIYSASVELHGKHLQEDFCCLRKVGLTL